MFGIPFTGCEYLSLILLLVCVISGCSAVFKLRKKTSLITGVAILLMSLGVYTDILIVVAVVLPDEYPNVLRFISLILGGTL